MSEQDRFDLEVEAMLPCPTYKDTVICHDPESGITLHAQSCPSWRRHAVASRLRADAEDIALYKELHKQAEEAYGLSVKRENELNDKIRADALELAARDNQITQLLATNDKWVVELQQAKEAVQHSQEGKPLGELAGKHMIVNMGAEIARLKAAAVDLAEIAQRQDLELTRLKAELAKTVDSVVIVAGGVRLES